ncbi:hypothetical protein BN1263560168 [Stenotrophomonas indicatrix]|nr:hypothetical protein BN1263560168 [Stenotrophomonas indicatrix]
MPTNGVGTYLDCVPTEVGTYRGKASHVHNTCTGESPTNPGTQEGHLRVQPGHRFRVVRLLPVWLACGDHRQAVLQWRQ